jgi:hypothetical protein
MQPHPRTDTNQQQQAKIFRGASDATTERISRGTTNDCSAAEQ